MNVDLGKLLDDGNKLGSISNVPPEFAQTDQWLKKVKEENLLLYANATGGINNGLADKLVEASANIVKIKSYINNASNEMADYLSLLTPNP